MSQANHPPTSQPRPSSPPTTYVTRAEFEKTHSALKTKVDDLRKALNDLKQRLAAA
jgi:hypothetical protein